MACKKIQIIETSGLLIGKTLQLSSLYTCKLILLICTYSKKKPKKTNLVKWLNMGQVWVGDAAGEVSTQLRYFQSLFLFTGNYVLDQTISKRVC